MKLLSTKEQGIENQIVEKIARDTQRPTKTT